MSGILKRTVYMDQVQGGYVIMHDWASVVTENGAMLEPFVAFRKSTIDECVAHDPTDMMARIDLVSQRPIGKEMLFGDDGVLLHGGATWPRTGY